LIVEDSRFATVGSNFIEKEPTQHGIIKSHDKAQHQGGGFATVGSNFIEKEPTQHGIIRSEEKSQHQGTGFGTTGSVHIEKEPTSHGIVRSTEKSQHQGAGFATMGSLQTEKELVTHGIIAPGTKIKEGPIDFSSDEVKNSIQNRIAQKFDPAREQKARSWLESILNERFTEESLQDALKDGTRLCRALNHVVPKTVVKINEHPKLDFPKRENVSNYLDGCKSIGLNKSKVFETPDLYEGRNLPLVIENVIELSNFKP